MRELTEYEKGKWFDNIGRFEAPEFLMYGSELGDAYEMVESITHMKDYGLSKEFVQAAIVECLDMYYGQWRWIYIEEQDDPTELGLPERELLPLDLGQREQWDWAMDWQEEHKEETRRQQRAYELRRELDLLERIENEAS